MKHRSPTVCLLLCTLLCVSGCADRPPAYVTVATEPPTVPSEDSREAFLPVDDGAIVRDSFSLQSGDYTLRAVHTHINDGHPHPTVLLIPGSGPSDCDGTVGVHKPLADIADGLAVRGIGSLRVDKRTRDHGAAFGDGGLEEEYLTDCRAAIDFLAAQESTGELYLLGHSLGGQIACILQSEGHGISGVILFNSSLRHMADICRDQYTRADPANRAAYAQYATSAKAAAPETARSLYYYGATDHYWATYNAYDLPTLITRAAVPLLVLNSTGDLQSFENDIVLWQTTLREAEGVTATIIVDESISHLGYEIDLSRPGALESQAVFPERILELFVDFMA